MEAIAITLIGSAVALGTGGFIYWSILQNRKRKALWKEVAEEFGGQYIVRAKNWFNRQEGIEIQAKDVCVFIDIYTVSTGKSSTTYTRGRVRYPIPHGPIYRIYREGIFSTLGKALGTQDIVLGNDSLFDKLFMVKCDDIDLTKRAITQKAKDLMRIHFQDSTLTSDKKELIFLKHKILDQRRPLVALIKLMIELGSLDYYGRILFESISETKVDLPKGPWDNRTKIKGITVQQGKRIITEPDISRGKIIIRQSLHRKNIETEPLSMIIGNDPTLNEKLTTHSNILILLDQLNGSELNLNQNVISLTHTYNRSLATEKLDLGIKLLITLSDSKKSAYR